LGTSYGSEVSVNLYGMIYPFSEEKRAACISNRMSEPEEVRFQRDSDNWKWYCLYEEDRAFNHYNLQPTETKLRNEVTGDPIARGAMDIFLSSFYWKFVDYCVEHLNSMNELNQKRFREVLILLAPGLESTRYMAKAVNLIGRDQREVRAVDMQYIPFCLDMFFFAAVRNGQLGRYELANMFTDAFYAPCLNWDSNGCADARFKIHNVWLITFPDINPGDWPEIDYFIKSIWPNWK
jgi:hypothetical protein